MQPIPTIVHLTASSQHDVERSMEILDGVESVAAVELGLPDDIAPDEAAAFTEDALRHTEKPLLVRLPLFDADAAAEAVAEAGAGALVIAAPPRGTAHDPQTGQLVGGRLYGPNVKPMALRVVGSVARRLPAIPVIGSGGIHTPSDARDFLNAGAVAVQVGSVTWTLPRMIEIIGRDLGGYVLTRERGALADEWFTGIGETDVLDWDNIP